MNEPNESLKTIIIICGPNDDRPSGVKDKFWEQLNIETDNSREKY